MGCLRPTVTRGCCLVPGFYRRWQAAFLGWSLSIRGWFPGRAAAHCELRSIFILVWLSSMCIFSLSEGVYSPAVSLQGRWKPRPGQTSMVPVEWPCHRPSLSPSVRTHASPQVCRSRADKAPHPSQPQASVLSRTLGLGLPGKMSLWRPLLLDSGDWHSPEDSGCILASLAAGDAWFWASEPSPQ